MRRKNYSMEEIEFIVSNFETKNIEDLALELKRTPEGVSKQIQRLIKKGKIKKKETLKDLLKAYMISKKIIIEKKVLEYEKVMISKKLKIKKEELEERLEELRKEYMQEKANEK